MIYNMEMTVEDILAAKEKLQNHIKDLCEDFTESTGLTVDDIDLSKVEVIGEYGILDVKYRIHTFVKL